MIAVVVPVHCFVIGIVLIRIGDRFSYVTVDLLLLNRYLLALLYQLVSVCFSVVVLLKLNSETIIYLLGNYATINNDSGQLYEE